MKHKARLMALGYDEKLADETAEALVDGNTEVLFANQAKHLSAREQALKAELLRDTPKPPAGAGNKSVTAEQFSDMGWLERTELKQNSPELYAQLLGEQ